MEEHKSYDFKIKQKDKEEVTETIYFEAPYIQGEYTLVNGVYANVPDLTGFNESMTYYVTYDESGNEIIGNSIKNDGSNMPDNWYDYSSSKWANIVITDGTIVDGQITNATVTTYYTWIPRYEFRISTSEYAQASIARTDVRFIEGTSTNVSEDGYQIPEAFTFNGKELTGYWVMKYTAGE